MQTNVLAVITTLIFIIRIAVICTLIFACLQLTIVASSQLQMETTINAKGKTHSPILNDDTFLHILLRRQRRQSIIPPQKPKMKPNQQNLQSVLSNQNVDNANGFIRWRQNFNSCPITCGGAYQRAIKTFCWSEKEKKVIDDKNCNPKLKPGVLSTCGTQPCFKPKWELGEWSNCSVSCGNGVKRRMSRCMIYLNSTLDQEVESRACKEFDNTARPATVKECKTNVTCLNIDIKKSNNECSRPQCRTTTQMTSTTLKTQKLSSSQIHVSNVLLLIVLLYLNFM